MNKKEIRQKLDPAVNDYLEATKPKYNLIDSVTKELIVGIITKTMPRDEQGDIIDKELHSDLVTEIQNI